jgi:transcription initiation factor TFIID subunit 6
MPPCPLKPDVSLHWLAVRGVQPLIPENPSAVAIENDSQQTTTLPQEMLMLYSRIAGIILASESSPALSAVFEVFRTDSSIQELIPYFCRFFYQQVKANTRRLALLTTIIKYAAIFITFASPEFQCSKWHYLI